MLVDELVALLSQFFFQGIEAAAVDLQVCEVDLVESMGFVLVRADDEPEDFVKRVLKKPVLMVDSWV